MTVTDVQSGETESPLQILGGPDRAREKRLGTR